jgi:CubicO group peptidase (beta-lactamase class C family)
MADARYRDVKLRQLLDHTAGMPDVDDYEWDRPQHDAGALKRWALQQKDRRLLFAPGESRRYSNIGFELLGLVVQETSGMSFEDYMAANILEPLGMENSSFVASEIDGSLRTRGHTGKIWRRVVDDYPYNRRHAPSSTLNSNVVDMSRFAMALLNDGGIDDVSILTPAAIETMWAASWVSPDDPQRMSGLGWNVGRPWGGIFSASHGGHDDGFRSFLYLAPEEGVAVFLASNDETISTGMFVRSVLEVLFPDKTDQ